MFLIKIDIIIQARMGSNRLPGKILKTLGNTTVLDYVVSRCQQISKVTDVVVATTTLEIDNKVEDWCAENDVTCFRGSEVDVLSRYYECAKKIHSDYVIRVTADCPFVDYEVANNLINDMIKNPVDYIKVNGELTRGLIVELFSFTALEYIYNYGLEQRHREHVTYYAYENSNEFRYNIYEAPKYMCHPELRITLDTEEDYMLCQKIANNFPNNKLVLTEEVVNYLLQHPQISSINAHIKQKPVK